MSTMAKRSTDKRRGVDNEESTIGSGDAGTQRRRSSRLGVAGSGGTQEDLSAGVGGRDSDPSPRFTLRNRALAMLDSWDRRPFRPR
jgi:hypothetical protein